MFTVFVLWCSPNHTPIKCRRPIKKRNSMTPTYLASKDCSYLALNVDCSKHGHMKWLTRSLLSRHTRETESLNSQIKKFDGRVLHVVVVIGVNVASDVQSVMADHFGIHPYCVTHNWFLNLCEFAIILTWQVVGRWSHTPSTCWWPLWPKLARRRRRPLMPRSHQTFRPVPTVQLLGIMFRNRCWLTIFHTITTRDADGRCQKRPVQSTPQSKPIMIRLLPLVDKKEPQSFSNRGSFDHPDLQSVNDCIFGFLVYQLNF